MKRLCRSRPEGLQAAPPIFTIHRKCHFELLYPVYMAKVCIFFLSAKHFAIFFLSLEISEYLRRPSYAGKSRAGAVSVLSGNLFSDRPRDVSETIIGIVFPKILIVFRKIGIVFPNHRDKGCRMWGYPRAATGKLSPEACQVPETGFSCALPACPPTRNASCLLPARQETGHTYIHKVHKTGFGRIKMLEICLKTVQNESK